MASEASRQAKKRYQQTEKGKLAQRKAQEKYAQTPEGKEVRKRASQKFEAENAEARREYKRLKAREYRLRSKKPDQHGEKTCRMWDYYMYGDAPQPWVAIALRSDSLSPMTNRDPNAQYRRISGSSGTGDNNIYCKDICIFFKYNKNFISLKTRNFTITTRKPSKQKKNPVLIFPEERLRLKNICQSVQLDST